MPDPGSSRTRSRATERLELSPLLVVVLPVEHVPLPASRHHPLRHAGACELIDAAVEREPSSRSTRFASFRNSRSLRTVPSFSSTMQRMMACDRYDSRPSDRVTARTPAPSRCAASRAARPSAGRDPRAGRPAHPCRTSFSASAMASCSMASSSSKFLVSTRDEALPDALLRAVSATTSAATSRRTSVSATRAICAADGRIGATVACRGVLARLSLTCRGPADKWTRR